MKNLTQTFNDIGNYYQSNLLGLNEITEEETEYFLNIIKK